MYSQTQNFSWLYRQNQNILLHAQMMTRLCSLAEKPFQRKSFKLNEVPLWIDTQRDFRYAHVYAMSARAHGWGEVTHGPPP